MRTSSRSVSSTIDRDPGVDRLAEAEEATDVALLEQAGLQVDEERDPRRETLRGALERRAQTGALELDPEAVALGGGKELARHLVGGALRTARKRLEADAPAAGQLDDRLIMRSDAPTGDHAL